MCDRVGVLYAGRLVEEGPVETVLQDPRHPYTVGLLRCIPRGGVRKDHGRLDTIPGFLPPLGAELPACVFVDRCPLADERCATDEPALEVLGDDHRARCWHHDRAQSFRGRSSRTSSFRRSTVRRRRSSLLDGLGKVFKQHGAEIQALVDVTAAVWPGETLGLVGESGPARRPSRARSSASSSRPRDRSSSTGRSSRRASRNGRGRSCATLQIVFQNPDSALNRRHSVRRILLRSLRKLAGVTGSEATHRMDDLASRVRITERTLTQKPVQLSGGSSSGSRSPARSPATRASSSATSRRARSTSPSRPRSSTSSSSSRRSGASPTCSSATTSGSCGTSRTGSRCCTSAGSRSSVRPTSSSTGRTTRTPRRCSRRSRPSTAAGATHPPRGRRPERRRAADRVRLPHTLPPQGRRDLRDAGAAARRGRVRSHDALSHSRRRAPRAAEERGGARMRIRARRPGARPAGRSRSRSSSSRPPARARCSSASRRAASATRTTTRSTAPPRRPVPPCSATRGPASSRRPARASRASSSAITSRSPGRRRAAAAASAFATSRSTAGRRGPRWPPGRSSTGRRGSPATVSRSTTTR